MIGPWLVLIDSGMMQIYPDVIQVKTIGKNKGRSVQVTTLACGVLI